MKLIELISKLNQDTLVIVNTVETEEVCEGNAQEIWHYLVDNKEVANMEVAYMEVEHVLDSDYTALIIEVFQ